MATIQNPGDGSTGLPQPPPGYTYDASGNLIPVGGGTAPGLPAPGSAGPGSYAAPPGYTYDTTTGQYVPATGYTPGSTPQPGVPGAVNLGPGQTTGVIGGAPSGLAGSPLPTPTVTPPPPSGPSGPAGPGSTLGPSGGLRLGPPSAPPGFPTIPGQPTYTPPPAFSAPDPFAAATFTPDTFTAPSVAQALTNPGYQFQVQQGDLGLQNWAAAKGTLNDSETAQSLEQLNQNLAQSDYQNVFQNSLGMFNTNEAGRYNAFNTNEQGRVSAYNTNEANRLQAYNTNYQTQFTDPYAIAAQRQSTGVAQQQTNWQDAYNAWLAQNQLLQGEQGLVIQGSNATG